MLVTGYAINLKPETWNLEQKKIIFIYLTNKLLSVVLKIFYFFSTFFMEFKKPMPYIINNAKTLKQTSV
jgi:hypothetical protein